MPPEGKPFDLLPAEIPWQVGIAVVNIKCLPRRVDIEQYIIVRFAGVCDGAGLESSVVPVWGAVEERAVFRHQSAPVNRQVSTGVLLIHESPLCRGECHRKRKEYSTE